MNDTIHSAYYTFFKKILYTAIIGFFIVSCGSSKNVSSSKTSAINISKSENSRNLYSSFDGKISKSIENLLNNAEKYLGVPYRLGGNTKQGLDCSGLALVVFQDYKIKLPRQSSEQANFGKNIDTKEIKPGDLLFFATSGGNRVSHVGIVHSIEKDGEIKFIHSSTSKGVIISSLNEKYWNKTYLHAQRVL